MEKKKKFFPRDNAAPKDSANGQRISVRPGNFTPPGEQRPAQKPPQPPTPAEQPKNGEQKNGEQKNGERHGHDRNRRNNHHRHNHKPNVIILISVGLIPLSLDDFSLIPTD